MARYSSAALEVIHGRGDGSPARKATRLRGCDFAARENRRQGQTGGDAPPPPRDSETGRIIEGRDARGGTREEHGRVGREMSPPGDAGARAGEGSAPSPSSRSANLNNDDARGPAPDAATATDPMVAEAEQSALTLLRRELAASRRATERERLVAKRACEQLAAERAASAEREEEFATTEARLDALMTEGRESAREEAFRREVSPSSPLDDDDDARRATSPPAAAELFKTPHAAAEEEEDLEEDLEEEGSVARGVSPRDALDPRAVAAAEALLARADALEHEHAREIAALNARVRALERALSSAEGAAAVAEAAAAEALRQSSRMEKKTLRRREREEAEAEAATRDLKRRLERERERADAWKARAIAAESKAAKMEAEGRRDSVANVAAGSNPAASADSAQTSQPSRVTFEEKAQAARLAAAATPSWESSDATDRFRPFSRKLANGDRIRVGSPSSATRHRPVSHRGGSTAPSARLATALAAPMRGQDGDRAGGRPDVGRESRDAFRASLRRQGEALARLAAGREARRSEMAALRDAVDAMGIGPSY